ncbi:MAG: 5-methyltetrahydropteroyltriglutamate--homocysteine S-methyltransferase [Betaproteobacteria bacterium RBG_16_66_20]|nr:MAG: 5-methyltetrahydropteroyltriglutamate--homocysteine S-methyltransferase [Betaproteobacteria bacterium RBG_16_66_20]
MKPPFRADQVGSLLRPPELAQARASFRKNEITANDLKAIEDSCIREAVAKQEAIGLQSITDGEMRRDWWHLDFMTRLDGVTAVANPGPKFGGTEEQPPIPSVTGKVDCTKPIMVEDFVFLKENTTSTAKFTIPSPAMLHLRGGRGSISKEIYPDLGAFWADTAAAYRKAIRHLADAGCSYLQLDDVSFSYLCDPRIQETCRRNGDDPAQLPRTYADAVTAALNDRPAGMTVTMHTCRGNFKSSWVASGGYEPVAEAMFSSAVDAFFMEFDSERAGGFEPLRYLPKDKKVVLGLVTSKTAALESKDFLKKRIEQASKFVPLENLCLSPQCGFSSTHHGNALTADEQWRKLERVVEVAREVWR